MGNISDKNSVDSLSGVLQLNESEVASDPSYNQKESHGLVVSEIGGNTFPHLGMLPRLSSE